MKFNIGDKVRVNADLVTHKPYYNVDSSNFNLVNNTMMHWKGQIVTISEVMPYGYRIEEDCGKWIWTDSMFVGKAKSNNTDWEIKITPVDEKTVATFYKGGYLVKSAAVKKYKEDKYSIPAAVKYVTEKLFAKEKKEKSFEVGARVMCIDGCTNPDIDGKTGTIKHKSKVFGTLDDYLVEFDEPIEGGHNGANSMAGIIYKDIPKCKDNHCFWLLKEWMKLI